MIQASKPGLMQRKIYFRPRWLFYQEESDRIAGYCLIAAVFGRKLQGLFNAPRRLP
jgi:hypothetical protein